MNLQTNTNSKQNVSVFILVGSCDFGRCSLASHLSTSLWPIAGRSSLERLLKRLADQEVKNIIILSGMDKSIFIESMQFDSRLEIEYIEEPMPVGTAGCIRDGAKNADESLYILLPSSMACPPDIDELIIEHNKGGSELTVILDEVNCENGDSAGHSNGIFICESSVLELIPEGGYFDIKEGLIPKMLQAGKSIHATSLSNQVGAFRDCREYLKAISNNIEKIAKFNNIKQREKSDSCTLWAGNGVQVDSSVKISNQVILMDNASIAENAVIIGPCIIGENVTIGPNSVIINSIAWKDAAIGENCIIEQSVLDYNTYSHTNIKDECNVSTSQNKNNRIQKHTKDRILPAIFLRIKQKMMNKSGSRIQKYIQSFILILVLIAFFWSYWEQLRGLWSTWLRSDEYSSGLLVPILAGYVLWLRRHDILSVPIKPSIIGLFVFIFAQVMRVFGLFYLFESAENISIVISIAAIVLLLFGWKMLRKVSTIILFMFLMLPWPNRIRVAVSLPLQQISTSSAVFCLELLGFDIIREGNVIHIGDSTVAVAEACNGLRMIMAFFVISGLVALLVNRTWWEKLIVLISSVPVAFLCNTVRLTITAIIFTEIEGPYWEKMFHDFGGYAMMPLALAFIVGELWLIDKLTIPPEQKKEIIIERQQ